MKKRLKLIKKRLIRMNQKVKKKRNLVIVAVHPPLTAFLKAIAIVTVIAHSLKKLSAWSKDQRKTIQNKMTKHRP